MINSANLTSLRALFRSPQAFIADAMAAAKSRRHDGFNIAFEPTQGREGSAQVAGAVAPPRITADDGEAFVRFLVLFTEAAHQNKLTVSVNVASWQPLWWNIPLLLHTDADKFITVC